MSAELDAQLDVRGRTFPLSQSRVIREKYDPSKDDPLTVLHPHEIRCAEMFALWDGQPETLQTTPGTPRKWSTLRAGKFCTLFRETFGYEITPRIRGGLSANPAWKHYVYLLQQQTRDTVMRLLERDAHQAYEDFKWSRVAAKAAGDYKETRLAASDHLDRIGATQKPTVAQQNVVVILKGRNFNEGNLLSEESASIEIEVVPQVVSEEPTSE